MLLFARYTGLELKSFAFREQIISCIAHVALYTPKVDGLKQRDKKKLMTVTWTQFSLAYIKCVSQLADFTTELAKECFDALKIPYIDPIRSRELKKREEVKLDSVKSKNRQVFSTFCEVMRNKQPFLKKATDDELEGMFLRMTPAERLKYIKDDTKPEERKRPSDESRASSSVPSEKQLKKEKKPKKEKKVKRDYSFDNFIDDRVVEDDYDDYSSDDVSLVSESENELVDEITTRNQQKGEKKKKKKSREEESSVVDTPSKIKHFKWS